MIPAQVKALQDEVAKLMATVDELEAKCERQKALLREALTWCPRKPAFGTVKGSMGDLGDRIEAELGDKT
jgi:hypothetical protein